MTGGDELVFKISEYTPATIPMERLAAYMADLATLLGEPASVHFVKVVMGSTKLVHRIDAPAVPKVERRLHLVQTGNGPPDAERAVRAIDNRLRADGAHGVLSRKRGGKIIVFPGIRRIAEPVFGPFNQPGVLDGVVVRVGGRGDPVPVMLEVAGSFETHCFASRETARALGMHLFGAELRCRGIGRWLRDENGKWLLDKFTISSFDLLDATSLPELIAGLRETQGSGWREVVDPWSTLRNVRGTDEKH